MKKCSKCEEEKDENNFYKDCTSKDGYNSTCKKCRLEMDRLRRKNDPEWAKKRKKQNSEFHKKNREKIKERKQKWFSSDKGKESHRNSAKKYRKKFPEKHAAHNAVYHAIKNGQLFRPNRCQLCDNKGKIEAHHSSYDNDKRTSIIWLCKYCHEKLTN